MTLIGSLVRESLVSALEALDRRGPQGPGRFGVTPLQTSQPIRLGDNSLGSPLISHDEIVKGNPTVFAVWSKVVQTLSTTEIVVEQRQADGQWAVAHDHAIEELLRRPVDRFGLVDTLQWLFNPFYSEGNGLIAKYRDDPKRPPTALLPLDWRFMQAWARPGGPVELWASMQTGDPTPIWPEEVVHLAWAPPTAGAIGISPLTALGTAVRIDDAASRLLEAQYNNGLHFGGFLSFPKDATQDQLPTDTEVAAMKQQWKDTYGGLDNAFKVAVLQGGLQFEKVSMTVADAQLDDSRKFAAEDVYRAFQMRRSDLEDAGAGVSVEERNRSLHRSLINPTRLAASAINRQLVDPEPAWQGYRVRFDMADLLKGTYREELETAVYSFTNGMTSRNESRAAVGLAAHDDPESDRLFVPHAQLDPGADNRSSPPTSRETPDRETRQTPDVGTAD